MGYRPLTAEFLSSTLKSDRNLVWVQDEHGHGAVSLLREACELNGQEMHEVMLSQAWPMDLEEFFEGLSPDGGVIVFREAEEVHEYMGMLLCSVLMYHEFRKGSYSKRVPISEKWKLVMVTPSDFYIPDRALYRRLLKLVNVRTPMEV